MAHQILTALGWLALEEPKVGEAARLFDESLAYWSEVGRKPMMAEAIEGLASVAAVREQPERAQRLAGAADAVWGSIGHRTAFIERARVDRWLGPALHTLGETVARAAWTAGREMPLSEAVAYARVSDN
jgi:non-specific serine/threonine protein kinase